MARHARHTHYGDWLDRPADDPYWSRISPASRVDRLLERRLPMLFVGGWYDTLLNGTLAGYHALSRGAGTTRLVVGPWLHFPWARRQGALDFGPDAASDIDALQLRWFDHWLKDRDTGLMREPAVSLFDMGANRWRPMPGWPEPTRRFALAGSGRVSVVPDEGELRDAPAPGTCIDVLVHDPWRPAPSVGGPFGTPPGPVDRTMVDLRTDVLTFTTAPLGQALTLAGGIEVRLYVQSDAPGFDLCCTLSRVAVDGPAYPLAEAYRRIDRHADGEAVALRPPGTCVTLRPGERLRLSVAGAAFPAYCVNPGTGADPTATPVIEARPITIGIRTGTSFPSSLTVGLADAGPPAGSGGAGTGVA